MFQLTLVIASKIIDHLVAIYAPLASGVADEYTVTKTVNRKSAAFQTLEGDVETWQVGFGSAPTGPDARGSLVGVTI